MRTVKISTHDERPTGSITWRPGGRQVIVDTGEPQSPPDPDKDSSPASRGRVRGFSDDSARRLRRLFSTLRKDEAPLFVTLTYHERDPEPDEAKRDLDTWLKRLERYTDCDNGNTVSAVWRMEYQKRGTIHFHLLIYGVKFLPVDKINQDWHEVTGETSEQHAASGLDIERIRESGRAAAYLNKYLCKNGSLGDGEDDWTGRIWGVHRRGRLPVATEIRTMWIPRGVAWELVHTLLDAWGWDEEHPRPTKLYLSIDDFERWLDEMGISPP